jgi:GABA permease
MPDEPQKVLVVAGAAVDEAQLGRQLDLDEDTELKVIAPIRPGSGLDLVAGDVDDSIAAAEQRAASSAAEVEAATEARVVETEAGEADPLLAVEDALATFEADQIVLVASSADEESWSEEDLAEEIRDRFGLPVRELK